MLRAIPQHDQDSVTGVDSKARKHGFDFRLKRSQRFGDERVRSRFAFSPGRIGDSVAPGHSARIARKDFKIEEAVTNQIAACEQPGVAVTDDS